MKDVFNVIKNILLTNWTAVVAIVLLSVILKCRFDFSFVLGLLILFVLYFLLGCVIEYIIQSYEHNKKTKSGKSEEQLKREAEIRERRRARGMAMLNESQKNASIPERENIRETSSVRRRRTYYSVSAESADKDFVFDDSRRYKFSDESKRKKTPFDIEPPPEEEVSAEDIVTTENGSDSVVMPEIHLNEGTVEQKEDDVYVNSETLNELYDSFDDADEVENMTSEENIIIENNVSDENSEDNLSETDSDVVAEEKSMTYEAMTVREMQQTSADLSNEIKNRVNTRRRRSHIIFDAYSLNTSVSSDEKDLDTDVFSDVEKNDIDADETDVFAESSDIVDDTIPTTDSVDADQDKLDELYSEKSGADVKKEKGGFFSRAFSGFKKKRNTGNRR